MDFEIVTVAAITIIAFLAGYIWKNISKLDNKWIPIVCGVVGGVVGIIAYLIKIPDFPANDPINAIAVGIVSGFAAVGTHQIYKQLSEDDK